jgi:hypothetical protein
MPLAVVPTPHHILPGAPHDLNVWSLRARARKLPPAAPAAADPAVGATARHKGRCARVVSHCFTCTAGKAVLLASIHSDDGAAHWMHAP